MALTVLALAFFPLNKSNALNSLIAMLLYAALLGAAVRLTVPPSRSLAMNLLLCAGWAIAAALIVPLAWISIGTAVDGPDPTYGFVLGWIGAVIYFGVPLAAAAFLFSLFSLRLSTR